MAFLFADPTPITAIANAIGSFFQFETALAVSYNEWANKVAIPGLERASVERRLRHCKWKLNHYPKIKIADLVFERFPDQSEEMKYHIGGLLKGETGRVE